MPQSNVLPLRKKHRDVGGKLIAETEKLNIRYLHEGWIVENQPNVISGEQGSGKSTFAHFISAQLSNGLDIDGNVLKWEPRKRRVLYYGLEDEPEIIAMRCRWFGAHPGKIRIVATHNINGEDEPVSFDNARYIEDDIAQFKPRLVVFDVFRLCFGSMNITEAKHVNKVFALMKAWCKKYNCTILLIHHSKQNPTIREDCLEGSIALKRAIRSAAYLSKFQLGGNGCRVLAPYKMSWSKEPDPFYFSINSGGVDGKEMKISIDGICEYDLDAILMMQSKFSAQLAKETLRKYGISEPDITTSEID